LRKCSEGNGRIYSIADWQRRAASNSRPLRRLILISRSEGESSRELDFLKSRLFKKKNQGEVKKLKHYNTLHALDFYDFKRKSTRISSALCRVRKEL
jgi:hypothetical protein